MKRYKRLFLAVPYFPNENLIHFCENLKHQLRFDDIHWINYPLLHITVRFLGLTDTDLIPDILTAVRKTCSHQNSFEINIKQMGLFGSCYQPRVLWMGIENNIQLGEIRNEIDHLLPQIPKPIHEGHFVPHITLARIHRVDDKQRFRRIIETNRKMMPEQQFLVQHCILYQSILTNEGPVYKPIETISFL